MLRQRSPQTRVKSDKKDASETVKAAGALDAVASFLCFIVDTYASMMTTGPDAGIPYGGGRIDTMMHAMVHRAFSVVLQSVNFEICLCQAIENIVLAS